MPSSRIWSDVRENSASQVGNLEACWRSPRPITVRKVSTSGTNGVGAGICGGCVDVEVEDALIDSIDRWKTFWHVIGDRADRNCCGLRRGCNYRQTLLTTKWKYLHRRSLLAYLDAHHCHRCADLYSAVAAASTSTSALASSLFCCNQGEILILNTSCVPPTRD